jgi:hypothetical protein
VLPPERGRPALALLFDRPVPAPRLRRRRGGGVLPGERLAGLLLVLREPEEARRALYEWSLVRPLTMPDLFVVDELLGEAGDDPTTGGRRALQRRGLIRLGWGLVVTGIVAPLLAPLALLPAWILWRDGERRRALLGSALAVVAVAAVRFSVYVG